MAPGFWEWGHPYSALMGKLDSFSAESLLPPPRLVYNELAGRVQSASTTPRRQGPCAVGRAASRGLPAPGDSLLLLAPLPPAASHSIGLFQQSKKNTWPHPSSGLNK